MGKWRIMKLNDFSERKSMIEPVINLPIDLGELDSIVITDKNHTVVCCIPNKDGDKMIMKNGYHIYTCKDEPMFESNPGIENSIKYNPIEGN